MTTPPLGVGPDHIRDRIVLSIYKQAEAIKQKVVHYARKGDKRSSLYWDKILTSPIWGFPLMLLALGVIFWITIIGANYPSQLLSSILSNVESWLINLFITIGAPPWLTGMLILGMFRTVAWVVSVMLPPMAIFFPLFTILEDLGYLPRVAFNLDNLFKRCGAHGKQALSMCMGFGCNAAGVISCRIIDSPRERLIAVLTNNFVPCNGRFPTLILLASLFFSGKTDLSSSVFPTLTVVALVIVGIIVTFLISLLLSKTILSGFPSTFTLELPPYRRPRVGRVIIRSIFDRTIFVLGRAVSIAAPTGIVIWLFNSVQIHDIPMLHWIASYIDPLAKFIGLDGLILIAFILALPANEIVVPLLIMGYMSENALLELNNSLEVRDLFLANGWTMLTALNMMLFSLLHFPCSTTLLTIYKEIKNWKWTILAFIIPTAVAIILTFITTQSAAVISWISSIL